MIRTKYGLKHDKKTLRKISRSLKRIGFKGRKNPFYRKHHNKKTKSILRKIRKRDFKIIRDKKGRIKRIVRRYRKK